MPRSFRFLEIDLTIELTPYFEWAVPRRLMLKNSMRRARLVACA